jgi:hypothetical protein
MEAIVGKQIGDVKATRVVNGIVYYSKKVWQGDWRRSIRMKMDLDSFAKMYPRNIN